MKIVYYSGPTENTRRFVAKLEDVAKEPARIPLHARAEPLKVSEPYVLITPTYGGGGRRGADVPKQVIRFLNDEDNRALIRGVIASGNTNFGSDFCRAGHIVSKKTGAPLLYQFELLGTSEDVESVRTILEKIENNACS